MSKLWLIRHGETAWSVTGQHTGRTDIALTPRGQRQAARLQARLSGRNFALVLTSPLQRARETCRIAGFGERAIADADLCEWDYGGYEGRTSTEIRAEEPGWTLWDAGVPGGETGSDVGLRADRVLARALGAMGAMAAMGAMGATGAMDVTSATSVSGASGTMGASPATSAPADVALFAHGHLLRVLVARWLRLAPDAGRYFALHPASISLLGFEGEQHVIELWNDVSHLAGEL